MSDLTTALNRALERGETLEKAKISLINAGYSKEEIEEALLELSPGKPIPQKAQEPIEALKAIALPISKKEVEELQVPQAPIQRTQKFEQVPVKKKSKDFALIILILFLLLVIGGALTLIMFWDQIIKSLGLS